MKIPTRSNKISLQPFVGFTIARLNPKECALQTPYDVSQRFIFYGTYLQFFLFSSQITQQFCITRDKFYAFVILEYLLNFYNK